MERQAWSRHKAIERIAERGGGKAAVEIVAALPVVDLSMLLQVLATCACLQAQLPVLSR